MKRSLCAGKVALGKQTLVRDALWGKAGKPRPGHKGPSLSGHLQPVLECPLKKLELRWLMGFGLQTEEKQSALDKRPAV